MTSPPGPRPDPDEPHGRRTGPGERHSCRTGPDERAAGPGRSPGRAGAPGRRRLLLVCVALATGAALLEGAARLAWFTTGVDAVGRGTVTVTATGDDLVPGLSGLALLALAAVAAAVALAGAPRRVLGGLVAAAGAYAGVAVVRLLLAPPGPAELAALPEAPAGATAGADVALEAGPLPAALGAVLLLGAGLGLAVAEPGLPRFGARYAARPGERAASVHSADPDRAAWEALDAGRDPTADPDRPEHADGCRGRSDDGGSDGPV